MTKKNQGSFIKLIEIIEIRANPVIYRVNLWANFHINDYNFKINDLNQ